MMSEKSLGERDAFQQAGIPEQGVQPEKNKMVWNVRFWGIWHDYSSSLPRHEGTFQKLCWKASTYTLILCDLWGMQGGLVALVNPTELHLIGKDISYTHYTLSESLLQSFSWPLASPHPTTSLWSSCPWALYPDIKISYSYFDFSIYIYGLMGSFLHRDEELTSYVCFL